MNNPSDQKHGRLVEVALTFLKLGALSYGGPAIMGIMQTEIQEKRGWMSKDRFLEGLTLVNLLPGPVATQLGIFIGHDRAGWPGGVLAGVCFVFPAFLILMSLTLLYSAYGTVGLVRDAFYGIGPVVLAIFIVAVWRLAKASVKSGTQILIALAGAATVAFTPIGIATALLLAGCAGIALYHSRVCGLVAGTLVLSGATLSTFILLGVAPAAASTARTPELLDLAVFFLKVGALTFGGGITVLAFVQEQVVNQLHWLSAQEFLDGLALGQLTPGPLLMLAAYIGYKTAGIAGGVMSACCIFLPAFVLMLSILPVLERFKDVRWLKAAMKGAMPAVIGILAVTLVKLVPHAAPDAYALLVLVLAVSVIAIWRIGPLPLMLGGAVAGVAARMRPLQRLKELV